MMTRWRRRLTRGQALPEFALVLPVLMLVLLIAIDVGRLFYGWVNINNAARIAANYAGAAPTASFGPGSEYETVVRNEANNSDCTLATVSIPTFAPDTNVGSTATVSLSCSFKLLTPFISRFVGDPMILSATSNFVIRSGFVAGVPIAPPGFPTPTPLPSPSADPSASPAPSVSPPPPCAPGTIAVPNLVGLTVANARSAWTGAGFTGSFTPAVGSTNKIVTDQVPDVGECEAPTTSMVVQHT
jgi:hypothetical protein